MYDLWELKRWHEARRPKLSAERPRPLPQALPMIEPDDDAEAAISEPYLPTPEEIAAACREIRKEWSEEERRKRAGLSSVSSCTLATRVFKLSRAS